MELGLHLKLSKQISNACKGELVSASTIYFTNLHRAGPSQKNESKPFFLNYDHDFGLIFFKTSIQVTKFSIKPSDMFKIQRPQ